MKRVKLQPRQHTIVCNDEELDILRDAMSLFWSSNVNEVLTGCSPYQDTTIGIRNVLDECLKK